MKKTHKKKKKEYYYMFSWMTFRHGNRGTRAEFGDTVFLLDHKCGYDDYVNYSGLIKETEHMEKGPVILSITRLRGPEKNGCK